MQNDRPLLFIIPGTSAVINSSRSTAQKYELFCIRQYVICRDRGDFRVEFAAPQLVKY